MPPQSDKKIKQNHSCCGHPSACNSCSCPSHTCPFSLVSAATSSFLSSSSEHEVSRFLFFWSKSHLGQNGERKLRAALPVLTHTLSPQRVTRACRGGCQQQEQLCQGWGMEQMPYLIPGAAQGAPTNHSPRWLHLQQRAERLAGHTGAGLLSRTIPPAEQLRISPFHQHQVIQFHFCTSWVYLARRETSSLLSSC